jgi:hypothetical protein
MAYLRDACLISFPFLCSLRSIHAHLCFTSRAASHEPGMCSHGACLPARSVCPCSQRWVVWADSWSVDDSCSRTVMAAHYFCRSSWTFLSFTLFYPISFIFPSIAAKYLSATD